MRVRGIHLSREGSVGAALPPLHDTVRLSPGEPVWSPPWVTLGLVTVALLLGISPLAGRFAELRRVSSWVSEPWRLLLWQFVHWSPAHLFWDVTALAGSGLVCEWRSRRSLCLAVALSIVFVTPTVLLCHPGIQVFRGLSGLDCAVYSAALVVLWRSGHGRPGAWVLPSCAMALFVLKCLWETRTGLPVFVRHTIMISLPSAHLAGALAGVVAGMLTGVGSEQSDDSAATSALCPHAG